MPPHFGQVVESSAMTASQFGHIPFGKQLSSDGIHLELSEEEGLEIEWILSLHNHKFSTRSIALWMNEHGHLNRGGKDWSHVSIFNLIKKHKDSDEYR